MVRHRTQFSGPAALGVGRDHRGGLRVGGGARGSLGETGKPEGDQDTANVQMNGLSGFCVVRQLNSGYVPARDRNIAADIKHFQSPLWLTRGSHRVHILSATLPEANVLRDAIERAIPTARLWP
jgi:hypothetical protein